MLKDSLNKKTYIGDIEPNPKEFGIWIKEDGSAKIYDYVKNEWKGSSSDNDDEGSTIEYLDLRGYDVMNDDSKWSIFRLYSILCNVTMNNTYSACIPTGILFQVTSAPNSDFNVLACIIDFNIKTNVFLGELQTINEYFTKGLGDMSFTQEELDAIPRITKEQFYSLES